MKGRGHCWITAVGTGQALELHMHCSIDTGGGRQPTAGTPQQCVYAVTHPPNAPSEVDHPTPRLTGRLGRPSLLAAALAVAVVALAVLLVGHLSSRALLGGVCVCVSVCGMCGSGSAGRVCVSLRSKSEQSNASNEPGKGGGTPGRPPQRSSRPRPKATSI